MARAGGGRQGVAGGARRTTRCCGGRRPSTRTLRARTPTAHGVAAPAYRAVFGRLVAADCAPRREERQLSGAWRRGLHAGGETVRLWTEPRPRVVRRENDSVRLRGVQRTRSHPLRGVQRARRCVRLWRGAVGGGHPRHRTVCRPDAAASADGRVDAGHAPTAAAFTDGRPAPGAHPVGVLARGSRPATPHAADRRGAGTHPREYEQAEIKTVGGAVTDWHGWWTHPAPSVRCPRMRCTTEEPCMGDACIRGVPK
eukprot:ctg_5624.g484